MAGGGCGVRITGEGVVAAECRCDVCGLQIPPSDQAVFQRGGKAVRAVRIEVEGIGEGIAAVGDFDAVRDAVAVGVRGVGIGAEYAFLPVGEAVAV